jgi:HEAT repeat protein
MKTGRGKGVAIGSSVLGLVVLIAGFAIKDRAVAEYYLWKLKSGDLFEREAAAGRLRMTGSHAVRGLLGVIADDFDPRSPRVGNCRKVSPWYLVSRALEGMGRAAVPALREALQDGSPGIRQAAADALRKIQGE